jgi:hypothetical protein
LKRSKRVLVWVVGVGKSRMLRLRGRNARELLSAEIGRRDA